MRIETFEMERMQSTWQNQVDYDLSKSGIKALTLRELVEMGFDLDRMMDVPLGYSQTNGTPQLRERLAALYPGATSEHIEVTNGTSEANYLVTLSLLRAGDKVGLQVPNYMQLWGLSRSLGGVTQTFSLREDTAWEPDWEEFEKAVVPGTRLVYVSNPNNPTGAVLSDSAMLRIVKRCDQVGAYLLSDEVYLGAETTEQRTKSFWGISDRVIVTSGLSKAWGIPGVRIGWIVGPKQVVAQCWSQHDYVTIGPNILSDAIASVAVTPANRERCYKRTREVLATNLGIVRDWVQSFRGFLEWREPQAATIGLIKYRASIPSVDVADWIRVRQSTLVVPGSQLGVEGYLRIWLGGSKDVMQEGFRRVGAELRKLEHNQHPGVAGR